MSYPIEEQLLKFNRPGEHLVPEGFVIHSTATPGATAQNEHDYYNGGNRGASAHYFADWTKIIRCIPENEIAWHAGPTANHRFLSVEMCEPNPHGLNIPAKSCFAEVWQRTVWLVADACIRYGWDGNPRAYIWSHADVSNTWHETDHQDPIAFLAQYGKAWDDLLAAIEAEIKALKGESDVIENAILMFSDEDYWAAKDVSAKLGGAAMFVRQGGGKTIPTDAMKAKQLITIGGPKTGHPSEVFLSGDSKYDTAEAVGKWLAKQ